MQKLDLTQARNLNGALTSFEVVEIDGKATRKSVLKSGKHISSASYLILLGLKKKLRNAMQELAEDEKELLEENGAIQTENGWAIEDADDPNADRKEIIAKTKALNKKMKELHDKFFIEIPDAFLEQKEFLDWTKESETEVTSILAEFLLKGFEQDEKK